MTHDETSEPDSNADADAKPDAEPAVDQATEEKAKPKKERVLHTRVPAVLEQELKRLAQSWRVPVSNVVRTILEDAVETVDLVGRRAEGELRGAAEKLAAERQRLRQKAAPQAPDQAVASPPADTKAPLAGAVGFTPLVLAADQTCAITGRALSAGEEAYLVLFTEPGRQAFVAKDALPQKQGGES